MAASFAEAGTVAEKLDGKSFTVLRQASETGYIKEEQLKMLLEWRKNPSGWPS